ncbi:hypothetical protein CCACVL1_06157 [Corchorus capsularis]|uniref:Uncharacterized protein n=1 Tax=Corchorus capsularis TaxID=210143 RepID=A0A1R3JH30_COCAP|nr:hypothetical protein CCACVL1_06157 [Corchorus capsularis]
MAEGQPMQETHLAIPSTEYRSKPSDGWQDKHNQELT